MQAHDACIPLHVAQSVTGIVTEPPMASKRLANLLQ